VKQIFWKKSCKCAKTQHEAQYVAHILSIVFMEKEIPYCEDFTLMENHSFKNLVKPYFLISDFIKHHDYL
jgi:hypothetical protein